MKTTTKPKPAEHHRRQFFLSFLAMSQAKKERLFKRYGLAGSDRTAAKIWEAAR
jgi:hypothetical protein